MVALLIYVKFPPPKNVDFIHESDVLEVQKFCIIASQLKNAGTVPSIIPK